MQKNTAGKKKKNAIKPIKKPYLKGNPVSGSAVKKALKVAGMYLVFLFIYLILGSTLQFDNMILRTVLNLMLFAATCGVVYMDGVRTGDADVAFAEIAYTRKENGREIGKSDLDRCYHPAKGVFIALAGALPFLLCAVVYALFATKQTYQLQTLPAWVTSYSTIEEISLPLAYYDREITFGLIDGLRIIVRLMIYPFINIAGSSNAQAIYILDKLSPLIVLCPAFAYMIGYWQGPHSRALTHGSIAAGDRKKRRRARRERKARQEKKNELI